MTTSNGTVEKTPVELEREKINVETSKQTEEPIVETNDDEETEEEIEETEIEAVEETEEEIEQSEKTEEELEKEKAAATTAKEKDKFQKRINKEVAKRTALQAQLDEANEKLNAKRADGDVVLTEADIEREAEIRANLKVAKKDFENACDRLSKDAGKIDPDLNAKIDTMQEEIGPIPGEMIGLLNRLDNGGAVLVHLLDDLDLMEKINVMSAGEKGIELAKISVKIKPKPKALSKVPAPNEPIKANRGGTPPLNDKMTDKQWIEQRNAQRKAMGKI